MKACLFSFTRVYEDSIQASQKIALQASKMLQLPITSDDNIDKVPKKLDALLIVNGGYAFCKCLPKLGEIIEGAKRVVWLQNDYTIIPPKAESGAESPFRKAFRNRRERGMPHIDYWTTCAEEAAMTDISHYVNWNILTFDGLAIPKKKIEVLRAMAKARENLIYYGAFRKSRVSYFDRYFKNPEFDVVISTPSGKKFVERYSNPRVSHLDKLTENFYEFLCGHTLGLYLEDKLSHGTFHSPPNRFYEMLSARLPMVFQPEAGQTLRKAGFEITEYAITNIFSMKRLMKSSEDILRSQQETWLPLAVKQQKDQMKAVGDAWKKLEAVL